MKVKFKKFPRETASVVLIPVFMQQSPVLPEEWQGYFQFILDSGRFSAEEGQLADYTLLDENQKLQQDVLFVGLGKQDELNGERIRRIFAKVIRKIRELKAASVFLQLFHSDSISMEASVKAVVEGLCFGDYRFDRYKSDKIKYENVEISFGSLVVENQDETVLDDIVKEAKILTAATVLARNLVNEPANVLYPDTLAKDVKKYGKEFGFEVEVLNRDEIEKLDMKAFLSVANGSGEGNQPKLIVMRYNGDPESPDKVLGLVGKGLLYDSGGYSIKPTDGMVTMKSDMAGAAAVIGAIGAAAKRQLHVNVVGVVAACENLISGDAYKPGDVIGSMAGKTIEVVNTDAEGRLTLADAVTYILRNEKVQRVVDIATLTGAVIVALGTNVTGAVTNNAEFLSEVRAAGSISEERIWELPSYGDYKKLIKSDIADLKNSTGRNAGAITAGLFIGEFAEGKPWVHLDIAGTSWSDSDQDYRSKGGTGVGVRTLYYLTKHYAK